MDIINSAVRKNNWYVITGGPGSGKTTTINILHSRGYQTTIEHARHYIDMQREIGKSVTEVRNHLREFQLAVLKLQIEQEKELNPADIIFLDRAIPDAHAYYHYLNLPEDPELAQALQNIYYKKVFILDCLPLVNDYARIEDEEAQQKIHASLLDVYQALPFPVVSVPVLPVAERADFILSHL